MLEFVYHVGYAARYLCCFYTLQLEQKQKYAVWKAADIRKALKEGRTPKAGPPVDDDDLTVPSSEFTNDHVSHSQL